MIRTISVSHSDQIQTGRSIEKILSENDKWYWIDFNAPTEEEIEFKRAS